MCLLVCGQCVKLQVYLQPHICMNVSASREGTNTEEDTDPVGLNGNK
jgi:hypothetical protein